MSGDQGSEVMSSYNSSIQSARSLRRTSALLIFVLGVLPIAAHAEERHHLSLLLAQSDVLDEHEDGFTLGVDYEYALTPRLGAGFVLERAYGDVDASSLFAVLDIHLTEQLVAQIGPGYEWKDDKENTGVFRLGTYYEIELGDITLAPTISYDMGEDENTFVYGVLLGKKF